jgi:hypothetical protein
MSFTSRPRQPLPGLEAAGPGAAAWKVHATSAVVHATLSALLDCAPAVGDPLAAELLGSDACGVWWSPAEESDVGPAERERLVGRTYAAHLEELGDARALAALRALQLGGSDGVVPEVAAAARRLAATGIPDPAWWADADRIAVLRGARAWWVDDGHRFTSVLLEVDRAGDVVTLAVATLDDAAGVVGDVLLFADLDGFERVIHEGTDDRRLEWLSPTTAQRRIRRAIERTDLLGVGDPPGSSQPEVGYVALRGLAQRWSVAPVPAR